MPTAYCVYVKDGTDVNDDLVKRLRSDEPEYAVRRSHLLAAADEIERLRGELDAANEDAEAGWKWAVFAGAGGDPDQRPGWRRELAAHRARTGGTP